MKSTALISVLVVALLLPAALRGERVDSLSAPRRVEAVVVSATSTMLVNAGVTELVKSSFHELRPDRNGNNSFPSRHTSWAFSASTVISNELYRKSPYWSMGAQALASAIGLQRVMSRRHYGSDVIGGAITGVLSAGVCYLATRRLFGFRNVLSRFENDYRPCISLETEAVYFADRDIAAGFGVSLKGEVPFSRCLGAVARARMWSAPVKTADCGVRPLNSVDLTAGLAGHFTLPCGCLAFKPSIQAGMACNQRTAGYCNHGFGFVADCDLSLSWRLTEDFAVRATAGYGVFTCPKTTGALTIGIGSVAVF